MSHSDSASPKPQPPQRTDHVDNVAHLLRQEFPAVPEEKLRPVIEEAKKKWGDNRDEILSAARATLAANAKKT